MVAYTVLAPRIPAGTEQAFNKYILNERMNAQIISQQILYGYLLTHYCSIHLCRCCSSSLSVPLDPSSQLTSSFFLSHSACPRGPVPAAWHLAWALSSVPGAWSFKGKYSYSSWSSCAWRTARVPVTVYWPEPSGREHHVELQPGAPGPLCVSPHPQSGGRRPVASSSSSCLTPALDQEEEANGALMNSERN